MLTVTVCAASVCSVDQWGKAMCLLCSQRLRPGRKADRAYRGGRAHTACVSAARRSEEDESTATRLASHNNPLAATAMATVPPVLDPEQ